VLEDVRDSRGLVVLSADDEEVLDVEAEGVVERVDVIVRVDVEDVVEVRDEVVVLEINALAELVLDTVVVRVDVGEIKAEAEGCDVCVVIAVGTEDRVLVEVLVAVRLLVDVRVGKILFSRRNLPFDAITH
jgi:hypothetical protein